MGGLLLGGLASFVPGFPGCAVALLGLVAFAGLTDFPGLAFVGMHWLHKRKSSLFIGVGEDAEHVVEQLNA